jgi:hypothetical protein
LVWKWWENRWKSLKTCLKWWGNDGKSLKSSFSDQFQTHFWNPATHGLNPGWRKIIKCQLANWSHP